MKPKLYVFDISNMIHRAFYAMAKNNLTTSEGFPTGAIYGTFNMFFTFIKKHKPENILICYDAQTGQSIRKEIYPLYKSNREPVNAVSAQERVIRRIVDLLDMASIEWPGYEADDLIGTAVAHLKDQYEIVVVTGDKDLLCLVQDGVTVYDSMKDIYYDRDEVFKKFGVEPNQVTDFLALVGDPVDCIPGVAGIGKISAAKLLNQYGNVMNIHNAAFVTKEIKGATGDKLRKGGKEMSLGLELASLKILNVDWNSINLPFNPTPNKNLIDLLVRLNFDKSLIKLNAIWKIYDNRKKVSNSSKMG